MIHSYLTEEVTFSSIWHQPDMHLTIRHFRLHYHNETTALPLFHRGIDQASLLSATALKDPANQKASLITSVEFLYISICVETTQTASNLMHFDTMV